MEERKIIHQGILVNGDWRYFCNQACGITKGKYTIVQENITCKNCLRANKKT